MHATIQQMLKKSSILWLILLIVLSYASLPPATASTISQQAFFSLAEKYGTPITKSGYLNIIANEATDDPLTYSLLVENEQQNYKLVFQEAKAPHQPIYDLVQIKGYYYEQQIFVSDFESTIKNLKGKIINSSPVEAQGNQIVNAFIVRDPNFNNALPTDFTVEIMNQLIFSNIGASLANFIQEVSKGKLNISGNTYGVIDIAGFCTEENFSSQTKLLVNYLENNLPQAISSTNRIIIFTHDTCGGETVADGRGTLGKNTITSNANQSYLLSISMLFGTSLQSAINHEFGHNLGLQHDNYNVCGTSLLEQDCDSLEYGGNFNTMGSTFYNPSFNSINKFDLNWLQDSEIIELDANNIINEEFEIFSLNKNDSSLKTIKIKRKSGDKLYLEYRNPIGVERYDRGGTESPSKFYDYKFNGTLLYLNNDNYKRSSILLDPKFRDYRNELELNPTYGYFPKTGSNILSNIRSNSVLKDIFDDQASSLRIIPLETTENSSRVIIQANVTAESNLALDFNYSPSSTNSKSFNFTTTVDPSQVKKYIWDFGDGSTASEANPTHHFNKSGLTNISLTIIDSNNLLATINKTIEVPNEAPTVDFSYTPEKPNIGDEVKGTSLSQDSDGEIKNNIWSFAGVTSSSNAHIFNECGSYDMSLTSYDNLGASSSKTKSIFIAGPDCTNEWLLDGYAETINTNDSFPGYFSLIPYSFIVLGTDQPINNTDRTSLVKYEWDLDGDGNFEEESTTHYIQNLTFPNSGSKTILVRITTQEGHSYLLSKTINVVDTFSLIESKANGVINDAEQANIINLNPRTATKVEMQFSNNSPWIVKIRAEPRVDQKKIIHFPSKKKFANLYFNDTAPKTLKFKVAPIKLLKKFIIPDAEGFYNIDLEFYSLLYGADTNARYHFTIKAK